MKVLVTGATGFIGSHLCERLGKTGHAVTALSRDADSARRRLPSLKDVFPWSPLDSSPPQEVFSGVDGVIHLAGERVAGLWTARKRRAIPDCRVLGTRHLVSGIEKLASRPKVLISASAIGYYGDRGEETLTEASPPGSDFLADTCSAWEAEAERAKTLGLRVVRLRNGLVMGPGSALVAMLLPFKMGLGGPLGSGRQWWPWIHLDDVIGLIAYALEKEIEGPLNAVSPQPVRQKDFARTLGRVLGRPAFFPAPSFALRIAMGGFSGELLGSRRVLPRRAEEAGYPFLFPGLEPALREVLSKGS